jgi:hypothetical protein
MNERAFTLYTALLSFILILLAALLVNTMINAERISNEVVLEVEAQSRMQSFADLTRADALQVVNYGIRNAIEEYTQNTGNAYPYSSNTTNWEQVQDNFSNFFFGGNGGGVLAGRIAANLSVIVSTNQRQIGGYSITIEGGNESQLKAAIQDVFKDTIAGGSKFLEVVDCDIAKAPVDCVGTFYVNLDFSTIDDATYESLPSIHVKDATTGRELVEPVIPRGKFRIYIPLRIFRALRYAHYIANGSVADGEGIVGNGLLSSDFSEKLGLLGVGMCDYEVSPGVSNCGYRTHPFTEANPAKLGPGPLSSTDGGFLCPAEQAGITAIENAYPKNVPLMCDPTASSLGLCSGTGPVLNAAGNPVTYNPSDAVSRANALGALVKGIINNSVTVTLNPATTLDFELLTNSLLIEPKVTSFESKTIQYEGFDALATAATAAHCTKLVETNVVLTFKETNLNYIVVDSRNPLLYDVRIVDTFNPNASSGVCVSYCIQPGISFTDVVFGPTLSPDAATCPQTACAPPNTYQKELCGNGVLDTGEECDKLSTPTIACELVPPAGQYLKGNDATCNGSCKIVPAACVKANECGNNVTEGTEECDGTDTAACPVTAPNCNPACKCVGPPAGP